MTMKTRTITTRAGILAAAAAVFFCAGRSFSEPSSPGRAPKQEDVVKMLEAVSAPVKQHELLEHLNGVWSQSSRIWVRGLAKPIETMGTTRNAWILGKRFVFCKGATEPDQPIASEHIGIYGYDTRTKLYTVTGIDTFGTGSIQADGYFDAANNLLKLRGETREPDKPALKFRWELTFDSSTQNTLRIYLNTGASEWFQSAEVVSTKK